MARNGKSNGRRNGVPAWAAADLKLLKKVAVSIVEDTRETRRLIADTRRQIARSDARHEESLRENAARFRQNEERIRQNEERIGQNEESIRQNAERIRLNEKRIAQNENLLVDWKLDHRAEMDSIRAESKEFKKMSNIHSRAILKLMKK